MPTLLARAVARIHRTLVPPRQPPIVWSGGGAPRVLYVAGLRGATHRYRVLHQAEQLVLAGGAWAFADENHPQLARTVADADLLMLYRPNTTPAVRAALAAARARGIAVWYDTDDLGWDARLIQWCFVAARYDAATVRRYLAGYRATAALMAQVDGFVASTPYLAAQIAAHFPQPVAVHANAASAESLALSDTAWQQRRALRDGGRVVIGYASGWPRAHEEDFGVALAALVRVMHARPQVDLALFGHLDLALVPDLPRARVRVQPFAPWAQVPAWHATIDINLAPLLDNPHRRAKSNIKWLEAALAGVPTIASDLDPYRDIVDGTTGILASSADEWYSATLKLVDSRAGRAATGAAARAQVLATHTTTACAAAYLAIVRAACAQTPRRGKDRR